MAESSVALNPASVPGGAAASTWLDAGNKHHQEVIVQTQTGGSDPVSVSASNPLPVGGPAAELATATGNPQRVGGIYKATPPTITDGQIATLLLDANGNLKVNIVAGAAAGGTSSNVGAAAPGAATAAGFKDGSGNMQLAVVDGSGNLKVNIAAGGVPAGVDNAAFTASSTQGLPLMAVADNSHGVGDVTQGNQGTPKMTLDRKLFVTLGANTAGGWTPSKKISAATTNATSLKASAGQIGELYGTNNAGTWAYLKLYDKASAPTVGTDVPVHVIGLPPNSGGQLAVPAGLQFATGIAYAITGGIADADTTAVALNQVAINFGIA